MQDDEQEKAGAAEGRTQTHPGEARPSDLNDPQWQAEFFSRKRMERARIPPRFMTKSLENFKADTKIRKELLRGAKMYAKSFGEGKEGTCDRGLLMIGDVGCGKTHLAVAILQKIIEKGFSGLYYNSPNLLRDIRATFDKENDLREDDLLEEVTTTDMLVFDDVGAENSTQFVLDRFYLIINERYEAGKPVIVTTNLDQAALEERLGSRIVSRLLEMCQTFSAFPNEDWRRKNLH